MAEKRLLAPPPPPAPGPQRRAGAEMLPQRSAPAHRENLSMPSCWPDSRPRHDAAWPPAVGRGPIPTATPGGPPAGRAIAASAVAWHPPHYVRRRRPQTSDPDATQHPGLSVDGSARQGLCQNALRRELEASRHAQVWEAAQQRVDLHLDLAQRHPHLQHGRIAHGGGA